MSEKSCITCPSRIPADEVPVRTDVATVGQEVDVCAALGYPLGSSRMNTAEKSKLMDLLGEDCASWGHVPDDKVKIPHARVGTPCTSEGTPVFIGSRADVGVSDATAPNHCRDCAYFSEASHVQREFGWMLPMCKARGILLPPRRLRSTANSCTQGVSAAHAADIPREMIVPLSNVVLIPVYGKNSKVNPTDPVPVRSASFIEPSEYPTDNPVSDQDREEGIIAWREIKHPQYPDQYESVFLPIFDREHFSLEEQAKIPVTGEDSHPELYNDHENILHRAAVSMMGLDKAPILIGPAGTGKTEFFRHLAWLCQLPFDRISITGETEVAELMGHYNVVAGESGDSVMEWVDGRLPKRWRTPGVLVIDEPNVGPPEVWQAIRPLTDDAKQLALDADKGQIVKRDPWCLLGLAINPSWDIRYIGTNEVNEADIQRLAKISVHLPSLEVERDMIVARCNAEGYPINHKTLDAVMAISAEMRDICDPNEGTLPVSWSPRMQFSAAGYTRYMPLTESYRMAVGDALDPNQAQILMDVVKQFDDVLGTAGGES